MARYTEHYSRLATPQTEPIPGSSQAQNSAGGYVWAVDQWERARRFLVLGAESGTYYATERALVRESAQALETCAKIDPIRLVGMVREFRTGNRAPRIDPLIFALAMVASVAEDKRGRVYALGDAFAEVVTTQSHLARFLTFLRAMRGRGRAVRGAVHAWLNARTPEQLAYQWSKYGNRDGWTPRDVLRTFRPKPSEDRAALYTWAVKGSPCDLQPIAAAAELRANPTRANAVRLIREHNLVREHIPTELLDHADVWAALLERMPATAMVRNLAKMTAVGLIAPLSDGEKIAASKLNDHATLVAARVNPLALMLAAETYAQGHGERGRLSWSPSARVLGALDGAFHGTFASVEPTGKRWLIAVDSSRSMQSNAAYRRALALALVLASQESECVVLGYDTGTKWLPITKGQRLDDVQRAHPCMGGGTDSSLPFAAVLAGGINVDVFVTLSDNETWAGRIHPHQALQEYRRRVNPGARMLGVNIVPNAYSTQAPDDAGCVGVEGFDANLLTIARDLALR